MLLFSSGGAVDNPPKKAKLVTTSYAGDIEAVTDTDDDIIELNLPDDASHHTTIDDDYYDNSNIVQGISPAKAMYTTAEIIILV